MKTDAHHDPVLRAGPAEPAPAVRLANPRGTWAASALLAAYYLLTMSRDMSTLDSPELALVAVQGGVGHPIGQPLHTLLGHGWVTLGALLGLPALWCLNALSALACALTLVPVVHLLDQAASPAPGRVGQLRPWLVGLMGVHAALWEPATRVEVYPLGTLLGLLSATCLTVWMRRSHRTDRAQLALAGLLLALCSGANAVSATFFALAMSPYVVHAFFRRTLRPIQLWPAVGAACLGMLVWAYIPIAARNPDVLAWGRPVDWPSLRAYLTGADYSGKSVALFSAGFMENLAAFSAWALRVGLLPLIALGFLGLALRARALLPFTLVLFVMNVGWYARYDPFAPGLLDYLGYLGAPLWVLAGGCAAAVEWAAQRSRVTLIASVLTLVAITALATPSPLERTRAQDHLTRELASAALDELPQGAILLVEADHWVAPLMYLQEVEARRSDVVVLPFGLASSSWVWDRIYRQHPALTPFVLRAPGGREARVRRFLAAQPSRPVFTNDARLAQRLGAPSCVQGTLSVLALCGPVPAPDTLTPRLAQRHALLHGGSPGSSGVLAWEANNRATALALEGRAQDAVRTLTLSLPDLDAREVPLRVPPFELTVEGPAPDDGAGSDQRNLLAAASIARRAQLPALAQSLHAAAQQAAR